MQPKPWARRLRPPPGDPAPAPARPRPHPRQAGGVAGQSRGASAGPAGCARGYLAHSSLPGFQNQRPRGGGRGVDTGGPGAGLGADGPSPQAAPGGAGPRGHVFVIVYFFLTFFFFFKNKRPQSSFWRTRLVPVRVRGRASRGPPLGPQFSFFFLCPLPFHFYRFSDISRAVPQGGPAPPSVKFEFPGRGRGPCPGPLHPWVGGAVWGRGGRAAPAPGGFFSLYKSGAAAPWLSVHTEARPLRV